MFSSTAIGNESHGEKKLFIKKKILMLNTKSAQSKVADFIQGLRSQFTKSEATVKVIASTLETAFHAMISDEFPTILYLTNLIKMSNVEINQLYASPYFYMDKKYIYVHINHSFINDFEIRGSKGQMADAFAFERTIFSTHT